MAQDGAHDHEHDHDHEHHEHTGTIDYGVKAYDAFGVPFAVTAPKPVLARLDAVLPPGAHEREPREGDDQFAIAPYAHSEYRVHHETASVSGSSDLQVALEVLGGRIREHVSRTAPDHIFIHAGVVGHNGRAIMVPGLSFSGKTTLVSELVRAGATYYSDEYAVLDSDGLVHPYAKPLGIRNDTHVQTNHDVSAFGGTAGVEPLPIGLIIFSWYETDGVWAPQQLSKGDTVLAVMANAISGYARPDQAMPVISKAVSDAIAYEGCRGEAAGVVDELLSAVPA